MSTGIDLGIVTSCHNYGRYLREWARSITRQEYLPSIVAILDNGSTDGTPAQVEAAREIITAAGVPVVTKRLDTQVDFGRARNLAVSLVDTEWVMHADCDDVLLPNCVADAAALADQADVICLAYERFGGQNTGPASKRYRSTQGLSSLLSIAPASGLSPFRRSLWKQSPYREDGLEGGWDTALWLGFAHLGARFVPTARRCFRYRQHADSVFATRLRDREKSLRVGTRLEAIRWGQGVSLCVPRRPDGAERDRAWSWLRRWWQHHFPGWEIIEADSDGPWCKPAAMNNAAARASGHTLVFADADVCCDPIAIRQAIRETHEQQAWGMPHWKVYRLSRDATRQLRSEQPAVADPAIYAKELARAPYDGYAGGGLVVVRAEDWRRIGGHDEEFVGWGAEDEALGHKLDTLLGRCQRGEAPLWHLWHDPGPRVKDPHWEDNRRRFRQYVEASGDRSLMRRLVGLPSLPRPPRPVREEPPPMRITVENRRRHPVARGGLTFRPGQPETIEVSTAQYKEIKACTALLVSHHPAETAAVPDAEATVPETEVQTEVQTADGDGIEKVGVEVPVGQTGELRDDGSVAVIDPDGTVVREVDADGNDVPPDTDTAPAPAADVDPTEPEAPAEPAPEPDAEAAPEAEPAADDDLTVTAAEKAAGTPGDVRAWVEDATVDATTAQARAVALLAAENAKPKPRKSVLAWLEKRITPEQ